MQGHHNHNALMVDKSGSITLPNWEDHFARLALKGLYQFQVKVEFSVRFYTDLVGSDFSSQEQNFAIFITKIVKKVINSSKTEVGVDSDVEIFPRKFSFEKIPAESYQFTRSCHS